MTTTVERNRADSAAPRTDCVIPAVNIREAKDAYILEADMPGVGKDALEITLEGSELTLVGRRSTDRPSGHLLLQEQRPADYRRVFEIAPTIDAANIKARIDQGLLTLTLPKSEAVKPRQIQITA